MTVKEAISDWEDGFVKNYYPRCKSIGDVTPNGVVYHWELAGPDGASFMLFMEPHHTHDIIKEAKNYLYRQQDVVGPIKTIKTEGRM
jgi:hypothetical protein